MNFAPRHTFFLALATVIILVGMSYIEPNELMARAVRKVDILSDVRLGTQSLASKELDKIDTSIVVPTTLDMVDSVVVKPTKIHYDTSVARSEIVVADSVTIAPKTALPPVPKKDGVVGIEDFSAGALSKFFDKLKAIKGMNRPIRIAVLGDSFIEGDIFTQDLRELLQRRFGGSGVGFVPIASGVAGFRQTVKHTFKGWNTHAITTNSKRGGYVLSSYTFTPSEGCYVNYGGSVARAGLRDFSRARLMFVNRKNSKIKATSNLTSEQVFSPTSSTELQQVVIFGDTLTNIRFEVENVDGFTGYGVFLDGTRGVCVDNFSVRGNSGVTLIATDAQLLRQMNDIVPYDLIILEYGLNVAQADVKNYSTYLMQMTSAIKHIKQSMPNAAIIVMGVPDRSRRTADGFATMPGIEAMARAQRELAHSVGAGYWSTLDAMKAKGGMNTFVKQGWAAKDYTHLSAKGGRELARDFYDALMLKANGGN